MVRTPYQAIKQIDEDKMAHNKKIVFAGIDLVKGKIRNTFLSREELRDNLENDIISSNFLEGAPFTWIGIIYRYGLKNYLKPEYKRISKKYGDLSVAIEIKMEVLQAADRISVNLLRDIFTVGALECLIDIGRKYKLPTDVFVAERAKYNDVPETAEEVESLPNHRLLKEEYLS